MPVTSLQVFGALMVFVWLIIIWLTGSIVSMKLATFRLSRPEAALVGFGLAISEIIVEMYTISLMPISRPLDLLPWLQVSKFAVLSFFLYRNPSIVRYAREILSRSIKSWSTSNWELKVLSIISVLVLASYFCIGLFLNASGIDALSYHIPSAVQPFQDGVVSGFDSSLPWTYLYPKGVELVQSWTMILTRADLLFLPVQFLFFVQLILASSVLMRKIGISSKGVVLGIGIVLAMPICYLLVTTGYIDIANAAQSISLVAILTPWEGEKQKFFWNRLVLSSIFLGLAGLIKLPLAACLLVFGAVLCFGDYKTFGSSMRKYLDVNRVLNALVPFSILVLGASLYVKNMVRFHNPFFPLKISVGGHEVLKGLIDPQEFGFVAHTLMGNVQSMNLLQKIFASWADIFVGWSQDSFGGYGIAFLLVAVMFGIFLLSPESWSTHPSRRFVVLAPMAILLIPGMYLPRYGLAGAILMVVVAMLFLEGMGATYRNGARNLFVVLLAMQFSLILAFSLNRFEWIRQQSGGILSWSMRPSFLYERIDQDGYPTWLSAKAIQLIHERSKDGDLLVWNTGTAPALLWNNLYSNRIVFLPGSKWDRYPNSENLSNIGRKIGNAERKQWIGDVQRLDPKHIVVYRDSEFASMIKENSSYEIIYSDSDDVHGRAPSVIFEKKSTL